MNFATVSKVAKAYSSNNFNSCLLIIARILSHRVCINIHQAKGFKQFVSTRMRSDSAQRSWDRVKGLQMFVISGILQW